MFSNKNLSITNFTEKINAFFNFLSKQTPQLINFFKSNFNFTPHTLLTIYNIWKTGQNLITNKIIQDIFKMAINLFMKTQPFELHLYDPRGPKLLVPLSKYMNYHAYEYAGPATRVMERIKMGQNGINKLDEGAKAHDIVYYNTKDETPTNTQKRKDADKVLMKKAEDFIFTSKTFLDVINGLIVYFGMKYKLENDIF